MPEQGTEHVCTLTVLLRVLVRVLTPPLRKLHYAQHLWCPALTNNVRVRGHGSAWGDPGLWRTSPPQALSSLLIVAVGVAPG